MTCLLKSSVHFCSWAVCLFSLIFGRVLHLFWIQSLVRDMSREYFLCVSDFPFFTFLIVLWDEQKLYFRWNPIHPFKKFFMLCDFWVPRNINLPQDKGKIVSCVFLKKLFCFLIFRPWAHLKLNFANGSRQALKFLFTPQIGDCCRTIRSKDLPY